MKHKKKNCTATYMLFTAQNTNFNTRLKKKKNSFHAERRMLEEQIP
jgi:hypothetical protein